MILRLRTERDGARPEEFPGDHRLNAAQESPGSASVFARESAILKPAIRKAGFILICLGMSLFYVSRVVRVYIAQRSAESLETRDIERAIRLVPDDAEFPHLLGMRLSASGRDNGAALANLGKAAALNPNRGQYWLDLASLYETTGDIQRENEAVQSALSAEPGNPEVAEQAGQLLLASGDTERAFPLFKRALERNPEAADNIFRECWRKASDANLILARAIPANPALQLEFLGMLADQGESAAANDVWQSIVAARKSFEPKLSFFYFDYLLKEYDVAGFQRDWRALADLAPEIRGYLPNENLIVNGSFEQPLLNSGFDWRHEPADHIAAGLDDKVAHSGGHSLSLLYDGKPAYDSGWTQFVPVQGNADYEFSAWIKSENVTTSSGPRIALVDAFSGATLLLTDDVLDTHPWQLLRGTFHVPAETELLAVKMVRAPANARIRGQVWIDDLRLVKR